MKKILVVLLILSVAWGVFAQEGQWSLSGKAEIGALINFDPDPKNEMQDEVSLIYGRGYWRNYDQYGAIEGQVTLGYKRDAINVGLIFSTEGYINGSATAAGENYRFQVTSDLNQLIFPNDVSGATAQSTYPTTFRGGAGRGDFGRVLNRLWGEYKMLNQVVTLEVAYRSRDVEYWVSDKTGAYIDDVVAASGGSPNKIYNPGNYNVHNLWRGNDAYNPPRTFTHYDRGNYILGNLKFTGLDLGLVIPNVFPTDYTARANPWDWATPGGNNGVKFVDDALKQSIFGAKFVMSPIEIAAQLRLDDYGIYFGGKFFAGPVTAGLSFMGEMTDADNDGKTTKAGASVAYNAGQFGAGLGGWYRSSGTSDTKDNYIGIEPNFFFNVIPTHLRFKLDAGFYFLTFKRPDGDTSNDGNVWAVQPQLFWNFKGTGAGEYYSGLNTGMILRYRIVSNAVNKLDVTFKFDI